MAALLRGNDLFTVWPSDAKTFTCCPPLNGCWNEILLQANSPGATVVTFSFPALKVYAVEKMKIN